jgi:hypothetical protein
MVRTWITAFAALAAFVLAARPAGAEDFFLAEAGTNTGKLWRSEAGAPEQLYHNRAARANPAYPHAIMKLNQTAIGADGAVYYCSGLDGCLMHLLDGRHEIMLFEFAGQIRDLATTGESHTVYFSVVPTPQNDEPLADGKIYRRDLWEGAAEEVAVVRQTDVGGNWWGTFAIADGVVYLATLHSPSRIYKVVPGGAPIRVFETSTFEIRGLTAGPVRDFFFSTADGGVHRTSDFRQTTAVLASQRRWADISTRPPADAPRP